VQIVATVFTCVLIVWGIYVAAALVRSVLDAAAWCLEKLFPGPSFGDEMDRRWREFLGQEASELAARGGFIWKPRHRRDQ
jgi:hypothetical protein